MSVTITLGGVTITGAGVTFVAPPPAQGTAGWFGGGYQDTYAPVIQSVVQRITFATDTATASVRGPLTAGRYAGSASGNFTYGWFVNGVNYSFSPANLTRVDRITYATDTATASSRGPAVFALFAVAGTGNETAGWFSGGYYAASPASNAYWATPQRITYATDTATSSARGTLSFGVRDATAVTDGNTYGTTYYWVVGGLMATGPYSVVQRIEYATDTNTSSVRGPLSVPASNLGCNGVNTNTYGWISGISDGGSTTQRITYATDTTTPSVRGGTYQGYYKTGTGNADYGWFGSGRNPAGIGFLPYVYRIEYATDTAAATSRGSLNTAAARLAGSTSGIQ